MNTHHTGLNIQELVNRLQDADPVIRQRAATILGTIGEHAIAAVPTLICLLKASDAHDRKRAALTLGDIGPAAGDAVPALRDAAKDENEGVSVLATWALEQIGRAIEPKRAA